jgi:predicted metal-binding protein
MTLEEWHKHESVKRALAEGIHFAECWLKMLEVCRCPWDKSDEGLKRIAEQDQAIASVNRKLESMRQALTLASD